MKSFIVVFDGPDSKQFDNFEDALKCAQTEGAIAIYFSVGTQYGMVWCNEGGTK